MIKRRTEAKSLGEQASQPMYFTYESRERRALRGIY